MIKSVVVPHFVGDQREFERLQQVLAELGFRAGEGWADERGKGSPHVTGMGAIELFQGQAPVEAELLVEVEDVGRALEIVRKHQLQCSRELMQTHWDSTYFVVELGARRIAFFQFNQQSRSEPEAA